MDATTLRAMQALQQLGLQPRVPVTPTDFADPGIRNHWIEDKHMQVLSFYDPQTPAFFTIAIERATLRTLDLHMIAAAHFMHHRYTGFDAPVTIAPPR